MNGNGPEVSIVIPTYNHERYVERAIRSALSQTLTNLEVVVIDDASTDSTRGIVDGFDDPRIRHSYHEQNQGAAATLNEGIGQSRGTYVAILNSDDVFLPTRLEFLVEAAEKTGATFLASDVELIDGDGTVVRDKSHWWISWYEDLKQIYTQTGDILQALLSGNVLLTTSNFFVRRDVFDRIGRFNDYRYVLDYEFILRFLADRPEGLRFFPENRLLHYRLHGANTIREDRVAPNRETFDVLLDWYPSFLAPSEQPRYRALERQLRKVEGHTAEESARLGQKEAEELRRLRDSLWEKDRAIEDLRNQMNERIACMEEERKVFRDILWEREDSIQKLHGWNVEKDAAIAGLQKNVADLETRWAVREAEYVGKEKDFLATIAARDAEFTALRHTLSYRLGYGMLQPLRLLRRLVRGF